MSRTASIQGIDRTNAKTFVRQESENLISPLRKWSPATINSPVAPPRVGTRELPPAPLQGQPVYDSPRPTRARFGTRPRSASLQCLPGQYLDMRASRRHYLYEPVGGGERSTIVWHSQLAYEEQFDKHLSAIKQWSVIIFLSATNSQVVPYYDQSSTGIPVVLRVPYYREDNYTCDKDCQQVINRAD